MLKPRNFVLLFFLTSVLSGGGGPGQDTSQEGFASDIGLGDSESELGYDLDFGNIQGCRVYDAGRYDMARGRMPVFFSTGHSQDWDWEEPSVEPMNGTAGEQWEFDGVSEDGKQAFIFGVYRDPNYSILGTGNLRVHAEFSRANGSRYMIVDYAEDSTVVSCPGRGTMGTWRGDGFVYKFQVSADMSRVKLAIDNPEAKVTILMQSVAPPRYANNAVWSLAEPRPPTASLLAVPHFYWAEPVPVAKVMVKGTIQDHGPVAWSGMGGHERLWGAFNWPTCLAGLTAVRLHAGSFALSFIEFGSARQSGLAVPSLMLAEDGVQVFATQRMEQATEATGNEDEDYALIRKIYGGDGVTTERLKDKVTGINLLLVSPLRKKKWSFTITHQNLLFEYALVDGLGGTGYSGLAKGGLLGAGEEWEGPAFTEIMRFPDDWWLLSKNYVE